MQPETLEKELGLKKNDDDLILIGCSPCQYWSVIQTDKRKSEKSKSLLLEFQRFVEYFNPGYVVVENVPGILSRMKESGLDNFIKLLEEKDLPSISVFTIRLITEFPKAVKDLR